MPPRKQTGPPAKKKPAKKAKVGKTSPAAPLLTGDELKKQARRVLRRLKIDYPDAHCALDHENPFQLLIATILSAQCTDKRVNIVTKELFAQLPGPAEMAAASLPEIETLIKSTGFYHNKAKSLKSCSTDLVEKHNSVVPQSLEDLTKLAGVGRKTANVVMGVAFGKATGVVVDTHVGRLSRRLGLTVNTDAVKVERDLIELLPKTRWVDFSHQMIDHGRAVCDARRPACDCCSMKKFCPQAGVA